MRTRVLVVDDSVFMRRAIKTMLSADPALEVVGVGRNGVEGVELAKELRPDVITLDIEMPEMDGLTALRRIMREAPTRVLMCSSLTTEGSVASLQALRLGAADVIAKDSSQVSLRITQLQDELIHIVKELGRSPLSRVAAQQPARKPPSQSLPGIRASDVDIVAIGSSTGGPPLLENLLGALPRAFSKPIVIAQHMPLIFTRSMASRLADICGRKVIHVENGTRVEAGNVYMCPGGMHTHFQRVGGGVQLNTGDEPRGDLYKPSVSALFESAAEVYGKRVLGVVLTGIGDDGLRGARLLHAKSAPILAQTQETCVVYGMPKAVTEAGLVTATLAPDEISQVLGRLSGSAVAA